MATDENTQGKENSRDDLLKKIADAEDLEGKLIIHECFGANPAYLARVLFVKGTYYSALGENNKAIESISYAIHKLSLLLEKNPADQLALNYLQEIREWGKEEC